MRALVAMVGLAVLAACAGMEPAAPFALVARPPRDQIAAFQLDGRIAVRRGDDNVSAHLNWQHTPTTDEIAVSGPLGQGYAQLSANSTGARLITTDHMEVTAPDLDALSGKVFGAALPVSGMARWVLGRASNGGLATVDAQGRLTGLTEQGWTIEYQRYESNASDALPLMLRAVREDVEVRFRIDSWSLE